MVSSLSLVVLIASVVISLIVGSFVVANNLKNRLSILYASLSVLFIIFAFINFLSFQPGDSQLIFMRWVMFITSLLLPLIYLFITSIKRGQGISFTALTAITATTVPILLIDLSPLLFTDISVENGVTKPVPSIGMVAFLIHFTIYTIIILRTIFRGIKTGSKQEQRQLTSLFIGITPTFFISPITGIILPQVFSYTNLIILAPLYSLFFVVAVGYSIFRHGLFDIRQAAVRSVAYLGTLATLALVYYLVGYITSLLLFHNSDMSQFTVSPLNVISALILAFIFQPVKSTFDRITNRIFFRDRYKTEDFYKHLNEVLTSTTDLRHLLARASQNIGDTLKAKYTFIYIKQRQDTHISSGTKQHPLLARIDAQILDDYFNRRSAHKEVLVRELLEATDMTSVSLSRHRIEIVVPLKQGDKILGFLVLGEHLGHGYTQRDIKTLTTLSHELSIAIQNAVSVQEIKAINSGLQQSINIATKELKASNAKLRKLDEAKDEFMSMASHQLRTPLTSVKGYMSMVLEGDAGEITPQQRHLLTEAFKSSERMVHLIADFLSVSRLQTGKFVLEQQEGNLEEVVKQEVDALKLVAKSHDLKLIYKHPEKAIPYLTFDEAKIRQVLMNFIDNAIYYSRSNTTITIALELDTDQVLFTVSDTGIGVPKDEQHQLFTKFFRAKNARRQRPDGTGVGLFLAKKVITAHGGSIIFHSIEGKGSTFGFRLPITKK